MEAKGFVRGRIILAVTVTAMLAAGAIGASSAQATLSPYPSPGYPGAWNGDIQTIAVSGNTVYVGGGFTKFGGLDRNRLAAFDLTTGEVLPWNPNSNGNVYALAVSGSDVYVGGSFSTINGWARTNLAKVDGTTGTPNGWTPNPNCNVNALAATSSNLFVSGCFTTISSTTRRYLAKYNVNSGDLEGWNPGGASGGNTVTELAVSGSAVYVGGYFTDIGGTARNRIAKINESTGALDATWDPNASSSVNALSVSGSDVYAAGDFQTIGGQSRRYLAKIGSSGAATSLNPEPSSSANALSVSGSDVYVAGYFTTIGGKARQNLAQIDSSGSVTSWNPYPDGNVYTIASTGTTIIVGGYFNRMGYGDNQVAANQLAVFKDAQAPSNASRPSVTGTAALGGALSCSAGSWSAGDADLISSYSYQWERNGSAILGATSSTYTATTADLGNELSCEVTAGNFVGSSSADSNSVTVAGSSSGTTNPVTPVTIEPSATFSWPGNGSRVKKRLRKLKGTVSADATKVEVAVQRVYYIRSKSKRGKKAKPAVRKSCRVVKKNSKRGSRFTKRGSCSFEKLKWLEAKIVRPSVWRLELKRSLPAGDYKLYVRAYDSAGNVGTTFSADKENLVRLKTL